MPGRQLKLRVLSGAGLALVAVTAFCGLIQAGVIAPQFRSVGGAGIGDSQFQNIENVSWQSWTITSLHLAESGSARARFDGRLVVLSLHQGTTPPDGRVGQALGRLTVPPGRQFNVRLSNSQTVCKLPVSSMGLEQVAPPAQIRVSAVIEVATPFGTRDMQYQFGIARC
jgi:hypothetical protein